MFMTVKLGQEKPSNEEAVMVRSARVARIPIPNAAPWAAVFIAL